MKQIPKHTLDFIDSWLELTTKWQETTGLAVAIMHKDKVVFDKTYGTQGLTKQNVYRVASHSKTFTAVTIMQLQEKDKLRIDDVVSEYLPWLNGHKDERWKTVTIRQLLSHSAGVMRDGETTGFWSLRGDFPTTIQLKEEVLDYDLVVEPNTQLKYSNFGYGLLGLVIEAVTNQSYDDYVKGNVIDAIKLQHTLPELSDNLTMATGFSRQNLKRKRFAYPHVPTNALASATGFCSSPSDLCAFFSALAVGSGKLLSDASKREMQRKQWDVKKESDSYGLGLDIAERNGHNLIGHSGGFPGFGSRTWADYQNDIIISLVVTSHDVWTGPIATSLFGILDEFGDEPPKKELLKYEGRFVGISDITQIVAHAGGLRQIWPNGWWPVDNVDKLKILDDTTLQIYDASGFEAEGERMHYTFDKNGVPKSITVAGDLYKASMDGDLKPWW